VRARLDDAETRTCRPKTDEPRPPRRRHRPGRCPYRHQGPPGIR